MAGAVQGVIKTFNAQKGFGFIACPEIEGDVYFNRQHLPALLQQSPGEDIFSLKGLSCAFEPISMKDGKMQARNLQVFGGDGVMMLGSIKTYNPKNQYGFIETSMLDGDVYFKGQDLPMGLAGTDVKGFQVRFSATTLKDGKMQARDILVVGLAGAPGMPMSAPAPSPMTLPPRMTPRALPAMQPRMAPAPMAHMAPMAPPMAPVPTSAPAERAVGITIPDGFRMVGTVNNFDAAKGFGFICAPNFPADVYFKGESEVCMPGQEVVFILQYTQDGKPQAREVSPPMQAGELFSGIVRRYNAKNGYGFLHVEGRPQDVYFQRKDLPPDIQEQPLEGAQFQFTVATVGGKVQAQDLEWLAMPPAKRPGEMAPEPPAKRPRPTMSQGGTIRVQRPASAPAPAGDRLMGMVKSFNPQKGFGFIGSPALPGDAYFSAKSLPEAFRAMPLNNRQVSFTPFQTADGKLQAQSIQVA